jgi:hypothetical protein
MSNVTNIKDNREGIVFTNPEDGKEYTLAYSLGVLQKLELKGKFNIQDLQTMMLNAPKKLFSVAFQTHHPLLPIKDRRAMYELLERYETVEDKDSGELTLVEVLSEMLGEAFESINPSGNVSWRRVKKGK